MASRWKPFGAALVLGILARVLLCASDPGGLLSRRPELSTPLTSLDSRASAHKSFSLQHLARCPLHDVHTSLLTPPTHNTPHSLAVREGAFWLGEGQSPYAGGDFHQPPLLLFALAPLLRDADRSLLLLRALALVSDVCVALLIAQLGRTASAASPGGRKKSDAGRDWGGLAAAAYMLNPYSILACGAACTARWRRRG